jgi:hypothetical protein
VRFTIKAEVNLISLRQTGIHDLQFENSLFEDLAIEADQKESMKEEQDHHSIGEVGENLEYYCWTEIILEHFLTGSNDSQIIPTNLRDLWTKTLRLHLH